MANAIKAATHLRKVLELTSDPSRLTPEQGGQLIPNLKGWLNADPSAIAPMKEALREQGLFGPETRSSKRERELLEEEYGTGEGFESDESDESDD